jgi:hypothetical protein
MQLKSLFALGATAAFLSIFTAACAAETGTEETSSADEAATKKVACTSDADCAGVAHNSTHMAICGAANTSGKRYCEVDAISSVGCEGFVMPAYRHECPANYTCQLSTQGGGDIPGKCVKISDIKCNPTVHPPISCPDGYTCNVTSHLMGASGTCVKECVDTQMCIRGSHWDATECKCVADANDCRTGGCPGTDACIMCWGSYACVPKGAVC